MSTTTANLGLTKPAGTEQYNLETQNTNMELIDGGVMLRRIGQVAVSASRTLALTDSEKMLNCSSGSAIVLTVPPNSSVAFPLGTQILVDRASTGAVSVSPGSGVTIQSVAGKRSIALQYDLATLIKIGTDTWRLAGSLS